jgi:UDP-N-acetyl-D-glucosamine dehydrogenase
MRAPAGSPCAVAVMDEREPLPDTVRAVVVGQGYVGLPLAVAAARAGHDVTGVDLAADRIAEIGAGRSPVGDVTDDELQSALASGRYRVADNFSACAQAEVVVLSVPTPFTDDRPDLSYVEAAATAVGKQLRPGTLVILESTTYPGTTEEVLRPLLEVASGLRAGEDFDLVFSPERVDPGNPDYGLENTPKIVGGVTRRASDRAAAFYRSFVDLVIEVSEPKTAEMAKLLENTFRHINIALVNELAIICQDLGVDVWEVIDAAASKPFGFMPFYPGPGVGGHCIPVDPLYLSWRARQFGGAAKFIELARDVNAAMPLYCVSRIQDLLNDRGKSVRGAKILVLGVSYKRDVSDLRESPAKPLLDRLAQKGADLRYHDPYVPTFEVDRLGELKSVELTEDLLAEQDCVVVVTDHSTIDYAQVGQVAALVFDTRNVVPPGGSTVRL